VRIYHLKVKYQPEKEKSETHQEKLLLERGDGGGFAKSNQKSKSKLEKEE